LYSGTDELPMEIVSGDGTFKSGDYIRFYAPYSFSLEDIKNRLILTPMDVANSSNSPKRIASSNVSISSQQESSEVWSFVTKTLEESTHYVDGLTLGDGLDHYFAAYIFNYSGYENYSTRSTWMK